MKRKYLFKITGVCFSVFVLMMLPMNIRAEETPIPSPESSPEATEDPYLEYAYTIMEWKDGHAIGIDGKEIRGSWGYDITEDAKSDYVYLDKEGNPIKYTNDTPFKVYEDAEGNQHLGTVDMNEYSDATIQEEPVVVQKDYTLLYCLGAFAIIGIIATLKKYR